MIKESCTSHFGGLGLLVSSRRLTRRLRSHWLFTNLTRLAHPATTITLNMFEKILCALASIGSFDLLLKSCLDSRIDDFRLLVPRIRLFRN